MKYERCYKCNVLYAEENECYTETNIKVDRAHSE